MSNASQLIRPRVDRGISQETWLAFIRRWEALKIDSGINNQNTSIQLFQCLHDKFSNHILANDPWLKVKSKEYVAKLMESVAVKKSCNLGQHLEHLQSVFSAKQKFVISQQSVSVNLVRRI